MNTKLTYDHILVRYGELSTKGKNRKDFINRLLNNIKKTLNDFPALTYEKLYDRIFIKLNGSDHEAVCDRLKEVFGISSFSLAIKVKSDLEEIKKVSLQLAQDFDGKTFKMDTKRHFKAFYYSSDEINRACATDILKNTDLKVDVKNPDLRIRVEVREYYTYIMTNKIEGAKGYPVGSGGKALVMLSGGIDSPVACYETQKRGVAIECIHFESSPYTSEQALDKVKRLASKVALFQGHVRLHIVPFTNTQLAIYRNCNESYAITIMRRMMYRIAEQIAHKQHCLAIVNGESLGQVASQTLESMNAIARVVDMPVLRPLVCMDKLEIIDIAKKINTYDISCEPFEDCCTIFTPKKPTTKPKVEKCEYYESKFDYEKLIAEAIEKTTSVDLYFEDEKTSVEEEDLF